MAKNYYEILQLKRDCTDFEINKAYKKLSLRYHPNKTKEEKLVANSIFHEVSEAYEVLSDIKKRSCYDQLGEFGLKNGGPDGRGGYKYLNNAEEIYQNFFKSNDIYSKLIDTDEIEGSLFGSSMRGMNQPPKQRPKDVVVPVKCTLEELYNGCSKTIRYDRNVLNDDRSTLRPESLEKTVSIRRGMKNGQALMFSFEGHMDSQYSPSDLIIIVEEEKHSRFKRNGNDLKSTCKLSLVQAIRALPVEIQMLDGRTVTISFNEIISPESKKVVQGEGMPEDSLTPVNVFGDLEVSFSIQFPKHLPFEKKMKAISLLS